MALSSFFLYFLKIIKNMEQQTEACFLFLIFKKRTGPAGKAGPVYARVKN